MFRNLQIFPSFDFLALTKHIQVHNVMAISCFILNSQLSTEKVSLKGFVFEERKCRSEHSKSTVFWKILRSVYLCEISTYIMIYKCWNHPECENQRKYCTQGVWLPFLTLWELITRHDWKSFSLKAAIDSRII